MTITIYHNSRCSKSRATLALIEEAGHTPSIVEYLNVAPSEDELVSILDQLGMSARDLMRKGEAVYKEKNLSDENLSEGDLIAAMIADPISTLR